jgi:hypothetical protein
MPGDRTAASVNQEAQWKASPSLFPAVVPTVVGLGPSWGAASRDRLPDEKKRHAARLAPMLDANQAGVRHDVADRLDLLADAPRAPALARFGQRVERRHGAAS